MTSSKSTTLIRREILNGLFPAAVVEKSEQADDEENQSQEHTDRDSTTSDNTSSSDAADESIENPCTICFESLNSKKATIKTCCNHVFHRECLLVWMAEATGHNNCPTCRHEPLYDDETYRNLANAMGHTEAVTYPEPRQTSGQSPFLYLACLLILFLVAIFMIARESYNGEYYNGRSSEILELDNSTNCRNVYIPDMDDVLAGQVAYWENYYRERPLAICGLFSSPEQCACYCYEELEAFTARYTWRSHCCQCDF